MRPSYSRAMLYGGLLESQKREIELKDISASAFRMLLKYIYTGCISLCTMKVVIKCHIP